MLTFSIIVPVYFNEDNLSETVPKLLALNKKLPNYDLELIFVDDGSMDDSYNILVDFFNDYPNNIKIVRLTRNFGSMAAIQAGFSISNGDCVGVISADLQDPPNLFLDMIKSWENGSKLVIATRANREDTVTKRFFSALFYFLVNKFVISNYPKGGFDFLLADKEIILKVNQISEKNTNIMTLIYWLGYKPKIIPYTREKRRIGHSRWSSSKKFKLFIDTFVGFSYFPIQLFSAIGVFVAFGSFLYGLIILISWLSVGTIVQGWVPLMLILTMTSGIQMTMLGILGEYLWRTLSETRKRPPYIINNIVEK